MNDAWQVDLTALRSLTLLAQVGTVAATADELGFTPSAVSQQLKRLEAQLGVPLVVAAGRGVALTDAGKTLAAGAGEVFGALEQVAEATRGSQRTPSGTVRIAAFSTAVRGLLAPRVAALKAQHPDLHLRIEELDPVRAIQALSSGAADLAIIHDADGIPIPLPRDAQATCVHIDAGDVIVRADHPLAAASDVNGTELAQHAWVTSPAGTVCHQWFERLFAEVPDVPEVRHRIDDFSTQLALVATGEVIALVPRLARPELGPELRAVSVQPVPTRRIDAVWRSSAATSPAIKAVVAALDPEVSPPSDLAVPASDGGAPRSQPPPR